MSERPVKQRRTGFGFQRGLDLELSERHRLWGYDAPMVDVDWLVIEYDRREPVALIDYKHENAPRVVPNDANTEAFRRLGERAGVPTFVVRFRLAGSGWEFFIIPLDDLARGLLPVERRLDEAGYVSWTYRLRGRRVPPEVLAAIEREEVNL